MLILIFNHISAKPARCESDNDCLKGKAKCVRRECQCIDKYGYGDGKAKCDSKYKIFCMEFLFPIPKRNRFTLVNLLRTCTRRLTLTVCLSTQVLEMGTSECNAMRNTVMD